MAVDADNPQIIFQLQLRKGNAREGAVFPDDKFQSLRPVIQNMVERLYIAANGILHGTHVLENIVGSQIFGINDAAQIQLLNQVIEGQAVYFCDNFGGGNILGKEAEEYIFLIQVGQSDKAFRHIETLFHQKFPIGTVAADDGGIRKQFA